MDSLLQAGSADGSKQLDFDEEVDRAHRSLADRARERDRRTFLPCVSFTQP